MKPKFLAYKTLRPWLWRWHRRLGLAAALVVVVVTVTGIMLNHTAELGLGKKPVAQAGLLNYYGIATPVLKSLPIADVWLSADDKQNLFLNAQHIGQCQGDFISALAIDEQIWVACQQQLMLFNAQGEQVDKITALFGLPVPVQNFGFCAEGLCLATEQRQFAFDDQQIVFTPMKELSIQQPAGGTLPVAVKQAITAEHIGQGLSWERVLLDLHSGRLFGVAGVLLFDIAALLLLFLALSGFVLWYQQQRRKKIRQPD